jgi:hypothetical protein
MRKLVILLVATLGLTLSGCALLTGSDGTVYGEFGFASGSSVSAYLEGFPSGTLYSNTYYEVSRVRTQSTIASITATNTTQGTRAPSAMAAPILTIGGMRRTPSRRIPAPSPGRTGTTSISASI